MLKKLKRRSKAMADKSSAALALSNFVTGQQQQPGTPTQLVSLGGSIASSDSFDVNGEGAGTPTAPIAESGDRRDRVRRRMRARLMARTVVGGTTMGTEEPHGLPPTPPATPTVDGVTGYALHQRRASASVVLDAAPASMAAARKRRTSLSSHAEDHDSMLSTVMSELQEADRSGDQAAVSSAHDGSSPRVAGPTPPDAPLLGTVARGVHVGGYSLEAGDENEWEVLDAGNLSLTMIKQYSVRMGSMLCVRDRGLVVRGAGDWAVAGVRAS